jgi:hypothetical protein
MLLEITHSSQEKLIEEFVNLPTRFRDPKYLVGLTAPEHAKKLLSWGLAHGSRFWIVQDEQEKTILRLSARKCPHLPNTGTFGFLEMDEKHPQHGPALKLALDKAEEYLRSKGASEIVGPIDLNTWFNYRFSEPGKKFFPRMSWEPTTPPSYLDSMKREGYSHFAFFHTVFFPHIGYGEMILGAGPMKRSYKRIHEEGFKLRPFDREKFMTHELPLFHEISHETFADSLLFEPIDLETFRSLYAAAIQRYDFSPSSVLISPEGETAGFIFAFFDGDYLVIKSIAIKKKFQGKRLSSGMIFNAVRQSVPLKKKGTISALVRTGLASELIEKNVKKTMWFSWAHYYSLVKKDLT